MIRREIETAPEFAHPADAGSLLEVHTQAYTDMIEAQKIAGEAFLEEGYVQCEDLTADGRLVDGYTPMSDHFVHRASETRVAARQIRASESILDLPTLKEFSVDPSVLTEAAQGEGWSEIDTGMTASIKPEQVVEISSLASVNGAAKADVGFGDPAVVDLYIKMMVHSIEQNHKLWVMATDHRVTRKLKLLIGEDLKQLGDPKEYMGSDTDPMCMNPATVVNTFISGDRGARHDGIRNRLLEAFEGFNAENADPKVVEALSDAGVESIHGKTKGVLKRRAPEAIALSALTAYAAARAVPLAFIKEFNGSPVVFGALDIGTVPPYVVGLSWYMRATSSIRKKALGLGIASASFVAPYLYLYAEGEDYPQWVNGAVAGFATAGVAKEVISRRSAKKEKKRIASESQEINSQLVR